MTVKEEPDALTKMTPHQAMTPHQVQDGDGGFILEWIGRDRRLGLVIAEDPKESSWFYVSMSESESGLLNELEPERAAELFRRLSRVDRATLTL